MRLGDRLADLVERRIDARPVAVVRIVIGLAALARAYETSRLLDRYLLPTTIKLPYVAWLPELTERGATFLLAAWALAALLFSVGWLTRVAGSVVAAISLYILFLDQQLYSNHLYLLATLCVLLIIADAGVAWSIDARLRRRPRDTVPAWPVFLLKTQLSVMYLFAALAKLNGPFLSGAEMFGYMPGALRESVSGDVLLALALALSWGAIAAEMFVAVGLWSRRWRMAAVACGVVLHGAMILLLPGAVRLQLTIFAAESLALYMLFAWSDLASTTETEDL